MDLVVDLFDLRTDLLVISEVQTLLSNGHHVGLHLVLVHLLLAVLDHETFRGVHDD